MSYWKKVFIGKLQTHNIAKISEQTFGNGEKTTQYGSAISQ
jgi:hypothetical protein